MARGVIQWLRGIARAVIGRDDSIGAHERTVFDALKELCDGHATIVFDIGAHHGNYARLLTNHLIVDKCYCFEPFPESYTTLQRNLQGNKFLTFPLAISDVRGTADFYANQFEETNSLLAASVTNSQIDQLLDLREKIKVEVDTVDSFCEQHQVREIDVLKIDTQGNTFQVLKGAETMIRNGRIGIIQCEVEFLEIYKEEKLYHHIAAFLDDCGYKLFSIYNLHFDVKNRLSWGDAIFIKHD